MAFTEGFISELVGRRATIDDLPIGKVSDFLVGKPDAVFPQVDGLVIKTAQGLRYAPIETVSDVDRDGSVALTTAPKLTSAPIQPAANLPVTVTSGTGAAESWLMLG